MKRMLNLSVMILVIFAVAANATTWRVASSGGDATTIQGGINLAASGDVVTVAAGTYTGAGNYNITFGGKDITLMSESGPVATIIDCQNLGQGVLFTGGETFDAVLEGFTIRNGNGTNGGAIYCDGASPVIRFNVLTNNMAWGTGGAIFVRSGSPTIYNNTLEGNGAQAGGGLMLGPQSNAQFWQNIISGSTSGGAFACISPGGATIISCNDIFGNNGGDLICTGSGANNFSQNPQFCGVQGSGNLFLQQTSPCTANFSPCAAAVGALGVQCTVTAIEAVTWGQVKSLYR
jgi:hypothetical protein